MFTVLSQSLPPHTYDCATSNCDINVNIKFIFDTSIYDPEWINPVDFDKKFKIKNGLKQPFSEMLMKKLVLP